MRSQRFVTTSSSDCADHSPAIDAGIDAGDRRRRSRRVVDPCSGSPTARPTGTRSRTVRRHRRSCCLPSVRLSSKSRGRVVSIRSIPIPAGRWSRCRVTSGWGVPQPDDLSPRTTSGERPSARPQPAGVTARRPAQVVAVGRRRGGGRRTSRTAVVAIAVVAAAIMTRWMLSGLPPYMVTPTPISVTATIATATGC